MNQSLDALRREIQAAGAAELPGIIGSLESLKAEAWSRIVSAAIGTGREGAECGDQDELLTTGEAAKRLHMSERFVRNHGEDFGRVRLGRAVRYSGQQIDAYVRRKMKATYRTR